MIGERRRKDAMVGPEGREKGDCTDRLEERAETRSFVCAIPPPWTSFRAGAPKPYDPGGTLQGLRSASYKTGLVLRCHIVDQTALLSIGIASVLGLL